MRGLRRGDDVERPAEKVAQVTAEHAPRRAVQPQDATALVGGHDAHQHRVEHRAGAVGLLAQRQRHALALQRQMLELDLLGLQPGDLAEHRDRLRRLAGRADAADRQRMPVGLAIVATHLDLGLVQATVGQRRADRAVLVIGGVGRLAGAGAQQPADVGAQRLAGGHLKHALEAPVAVHHAKAPQRGDAHRRTFDDAAQFLQHLLGLVALVFDAAVLDQTEIAAHALAQAAAAHPRAQPAPGLAGGLLQLAHPPAAVAGLQAVQHALAPAQQAAQQRAGLAQVDRHLADQLGQPHIRLQHQPGRVEQHQTDRHRFEPVQMLVRQSLQLLAQRRRLVGGQRRQIRPGGALSGRQHQGPAPLAERHQRAGIARGGRQRLLADQRRMQPGVQAIAQHQAQIGQCRSGLERQTAQRSTVEPLEPRIRPDHQDRVGQRIEQRGRQKKEIGGSRRSRREHGCSVGSPHGLFRIQQPVCPASGRGLSAMSRPHGVSPADQPTCSALPSERSSARLTCRIDRLQAWTWSRTSRPLPPSSVRTSSSTQW